MPDLECNKNFPVMVAKPIGLKRQSAFRKVIFEHIRNRFPERDAAVDSWWETYLQRIKVHAENTPVSEDESADEIDKGPTCTLKKKSPLLGKSSSFKRTGASVLGNSSSRRSKRTRSKSTRPHCSGGVRHALVPVRYCIKI